MSTIAIIPSRFNSSRFPGKPLIDIHGKTMIQRVYEQVKQANLEKVLVATDDKRIFNEVLRFGGEVVMTSTKHQCGTDRCVEALTKVESFQNIINIQGDEPFINPKQIEQIRNQLEKHNSSIVTLAKKIEDKLLLSDINCVKLGIDKNHKASWFDRKISTQAPPYYEHVGIYGFKTNTLLQLSTLKPTENELRLKLEQLRWMDHHYLIDILLTEFKSISIDCPEDLKKINPL